MSKRIPVVVTTARRGVFFGWIDCDHCSYVETLELHDVRNCVRWSGTRGFLGLAAAGPTPESRVGPAVPRMVLHDITSVTDCTEEAVRAWESGPWSK